jgi:hypothetical protein
MARRVRRRSRSSCATRLWGESPFARDLVRSALGAGAEARLPRGASLTVSHTVYRARSGETLYLAERDADRWVLRALSGAGQRSRLTLRVPFSGGEAQSELVLQPVRGVPRPRWSLRWSRRVRLRRLTLTTSPRVTECARRAHTATWTERSSRCACARRARHARCSDRARPAAVRSRSAELRAASPRTA